MKQTKYLLTKKSAKNGEYRFIEIDEKFEGLPFKHEFENGSSCLFFHSDKDGVIQTSNIENWTDNGNETYVIETKNSVYTLEIIEGE